MAKQFTTTGKFTKPNQRIFATAAEVLECPECNKAWTKALSSLKNQYYECRKCGWKGDINFSVGGGTV